MPKRPADDVETAIQAAGINDDDWMQKLLEVDKEELILIVSQIVNEGNIDNRSIKKARIELPSFSTAKWIDFAMSISGLSSLQPFSVACGIALKSFLDASHFQSRDTET